LDIAIVLFELNGAAQPTKKETADFCRPLLIEKAKQEILCMTSIFLCDLGSRGQTQRLELQAASWPFARAA
jgi:hypothetical protein